LPPILVPWVGNDKEQGEIPLRYPFLHTLVEVELLAGHTDQILSGFEHQSGGRILLVDQVEQPLRIAIS